MKKYSYILATKSSPTTHPIEVRSPYSDDIIGVVDTCNADQCLEALRVAHEFHRDRKQRLSVQQRIDLLHRVKQLMQSQFDDLVHTALSEGGKPYMDTKVEVNRAIAGIDSCIETIGTEMGRVIPLKNTATAQYRAFTQCEPIGVVIAISAFNHPLNLIVHQVGAAVAAGCPVLVKPSQYTPISCYKFINILLEAGFPAAMCQMVLPRKVEYITQLIQDQRCAFLSFIGSAGVGWKLRSLLTAGARCALEHGGVAPVIIDDSANIEKVVPSLLKGAFYHAGQVCVSVQRIFVAKNLYLTLLDQIVDGAKKLQIGDPANHEIEVGPLIKEVEQDRVHQWVKQAVEDGADLAAGGAKLGNNCYQATVLGNPNIESTISTKEIFGPVCCIYPTADTDQAIHRANSLPFAFQAAVFAQDIDRAISISDRIDASAVMINDNSAFRQDQMPFAGLKQSGLGIGGIPYTIEEMQIQKMLVINTPTA